MSYLEGKMSRFFDGSPFADPCQNTGLLHPFSFPKDATFETLSEPGKGLSKLIVKQGQEVLWQGRYMTYSEWTTKLGLEPKEAKMIALIALMTDFSLFENNDEIGMVQFEGGCISLPFRSAPVGQNGQLIGMEGLSDLLSPIYIKGVHKDKSYTKTSLINSLIAKFFGSDIDLVIQAQKPVLKSQVYRFWVQTPHEIFTSFAEKVKTYHPDLNQQKLDIKALTYQSLLEAKDHSRFTLLNLLASLADENDNYYPNVFVFDFLISQDLSRRTPDVSILSVNKTTANLRGEGLNGANAVAQLTWVPTSQELLLTMPEDAYQNLINPKVTYQFSGKYHPLYVLSRSLAALLNRGNGSMYDLSPETLTKLHIPQLPSQTELAVPGEYNPIDIANRLTFALLQNPMAFAILTQIFPKEVFRFFDFEKLKKMHDNGMLQELATTPTSIDKLCNALIEFKVIAQDAITYVESSVDSEYLYGFTANSNDQYSLHKLTSLQILIIAFFPNTSLAELGQLSHEMSNKYIEESCRI